MFLKLLVQCLAIFIVGFIFEVVLYHFFGLPGTSYGRWLFYGLLALFLIWKFDLGFGFRSPTWSRATMMLSTVFVLSPIAYWYAIKVFSLGAPEWEKNLTTLFVLAVWCPIFEELVFRQGLQQYWREMGVPFIPLFLAVNLLFAFYHPGFTLTAEMLGFVERNEIIPVAYREFVQLQVPDAFVSGILFSILRETSHSTILCIALHMAFNAIFIFLI